MDISFYIILFAIIFALNDGFLKIRVRDLEEDVQDLEAKVNKMQEQLDSHETSINNMVVVLSVKEEENGNQP